ncbi:flagellar motor switch protein FliG [[Clostridium] symbiosum]|uniref:flagellar motor switch protein FliG n=1 Tax=Clostridium symbiosum TaxID=1512 RepID=UPI001D09867D|nr:flagellar motor switch protein FliG [[Clostridium] symbiosum]MCB6609776.1 flagellar motor switch protein FliG [[Clostridium] symbiosum]MCB6931268.1 flagellar motor switch protein FliG [[Clostridium] symbiosum]
MADEEKTMMNPAEKAAAVISIIGAETASEVFKYLNDGEIEQISIELARLPRLNDAEIEDISKEFYECCVTQKVISEGGKDYAKEVLEKAFGQQQARNLMDRVTKALKTKSFGFIRKVDYKSLMSVVQNEHPQTLAMILSYATPEQASRIIINLPRETQIDVVERVANMDRAYPAAVKIVEDVVRRKIGSSESEEAMEVGGLNYIADVMNHVDRSTERDIFDELNIKNPQLAENVRKLMFVFEDIAYLDPLSIQRFIRDIDSKDIAVALKVANKEVTNAIFSNMSNRMRESIQTDMEYLRNIRMSDVEEAQQRIVGTIRRLEEDGEIVISKDGKDEIIV